MTIGNWTTIDDEVAAANLLPDRLRLRRLRDAEEDDGDTDEDDGDTEEDAGGEDEAR